MTDEEIEDDIIELLRPLGEYLEGQPVAPVKAMLKVFARKVEARARRKALEDAAKEADGWDMPCDPRTEAEQVAHSIAASIRKLKDGDAPSPRP